MERERSNFFKIGCTLIGSIVGAGFASGKEVIRFFGDNPLFKHLVFVLLFFLFFLTSLFLLNLTNILKTRDFPSLVSKVFKRQSIFFNYFILISNFILFFTMMSACDSLIYETFNLKYKIFGLFSAFIGVFILYLGLEQVKTINAYLVPIMIIFIFLVYILAVIYGNPNNLYMIDIKYTPKSLLSTICNILLYVGMNMVVNFSIITKIGNSSTSKSRIKGSIFASFFISFTIYIMLLGIFNSDVSILNVDIPLLMLSERMGVVGKYLGFFVIWIGCLTTLIANLDAIKEVGDKYINNKYIFGIYIILFGYICSLLGFSNIVNLFFPIIGSFGLLIILFLLFFVLKNKTKS